MQDGQGRAGQGLHADVTEHAGDKPPVVMLHGFGGSSDVWQEVAGRLSPDHSTLAYDLPGHHRSLRAAGAAGAGKMAKALLADLNARGHRRAHVVGHSLGGAVASLMALIEPGRIASLTLLAPGGFGPEINHRLLARYAEADTADTMRLCLEHMVGWNRPIPDAMVAQLVALRQIPGQIEALQALLPSMTVADARGPGRMQGMLAREGLEALTMPVRVLWGTQDRVLPTRQAHKLPPLFAAHVFEDTGHMLIEEQPDAVVALIAQSVKTGS